MEGNRPAPERPARWWQKIICWTQGHNLIGVDVPEGFSWQICRTCGQPVEGFRSAHPREPLSPVRAIVGLMVVAAALLVAIAAGAALIGWLGLAGFLADLVAASVILILAVCTGLALRRRANRRPPRT